MRRRGIGGMSAIDRAKQDQAKFQEKSTQLNETQMVKLTQQMEVFRNHLQEFATKHKKAIRKDPQFRKQFHTMCAAVGVDPLQSSCGFWAKLLGVGDFYYELAIQVVEVCLAASHRTGGFIQIEELLRRVKDSRNVAKAKSNKTTEDITIDDILKAIEKLAILGNGIKVIPCGRSYIIQSVAAELSMDSVVVVQTARDNGGCVNMSSLVNKMNWSRERASKILNQLVMEGVLWIDEQTCDGETAFWCPGLI